MDGNYIITDVITSTATVLEETDYAIIVPTQHRQNNYPDWIDGYAVILKQDGKLQGRYGGFAEALGAAYQIDQTLDQVKAYRAQRAAEAQLVDLESGDGTVADSDDDDTLDII